MPGWSIERIVGRAAGAAFDLRFINREMRLSGLPALTRPVYRTMKAYRALDLGGSASLSAVCRHIKLARAGDLHDAIEDAWLAMQIYLWLHGCQVQGRLRGLLPRPLLEMLEQSLQLAR
jgi:DNA polymerase III epsilon subunit-like protein